MHEERATGIISWSLRVIAILVASTGPASAEPFEFEAKLRLIHPLTDDLEIASGIGVAEVSSAFGQFQTVDFVGGKIAGSASVIITDPLVSNGGIVKVEASASLTLTTPPPVQFDPYAGPVGSAVVTEAILPVQGERRHCLVWLHCRDGARQAFPLGTTQHDVGYGVGGQLTFGGTEPIRLSIFAAPFEIGPALLRSITEDGSEVTSQRAGFVHGPASNTFSGANTLSGVGGGFQLVTATQVQGLGANDLTGHFVLLDVNFTPEPALLLSLIASAGLLVILARRRRTQSSPHSPAGDAP